MGRRRGGVRAARAGGCAQLAIARAGPGPRRQCAPDVRSIRRRDDSAAARRRAAGATDERLSPGRPDLLEAVSALAVPAAVGGGRRARAADQGAGWLSADLLRT